MDPITHVLLGATLGHAAFSPRLGGRVATLAGGLAAFAPDVDADATAGGADWTRGERSEEYFARPPVQ